MKLRNLFTPEGMIKPSQRVGKLPSAKEAYKTCLNMAWPSALEAVLIALISSADTVMVSKLGSGAIAAVGITTQPKYIILAIILTLNIGVTAFVARRKGEGDVIGAIRALKQALVICFGLSIMLNAIGFLCARNLLNLAGANADYINDAVAYFRISLVGNVFTCLALTMNAAQRGFGNTRISLITNLTANLVDILFNWLLINGIWIFPQWGVSGAAVATVIGNVVSFTIALISITRTSVPLNIRRVRGWQFESRVMKSIGKVWSAAFAEQIFLRLGFFIYVALVANLGTKQFATHQICMELISISFAFGDGLSVASTSLVGQGLGAKRPDFSILYGKIGQRCAFTVGIMLSVIFILFRVPLISIFSRDPEIIALGAQVVLVIAAVCLAHPSQVVISGCLRGAGDSLFVSISSFLSVGLLRPLLSYLLCYPLQLGLVGAWLGMFFDQFLRLGINFARFTGGKWTKIEL